MASPIALEGNVSPAKEDSLHPGEFASCAGGHGGAVCMEPHLLFRGEILVYQCSKPPLEGWRGGCFPSSSKRWMGGGSLIGKNWFWRLVLWAGRKPSGTAISFRTNDAGKEEAGQNG